VRAHRAGDQGGDTHSYGKKEREYHPDGGRADANGSYCVGATIAKLSDGLRA